MTTTAARRVVIADDDPLALVALTKAIVRAGSLVIAEARDGDAAVHAVRLHRPDLLIADMWMGHVNGVRAAVAARRAHPDLRVIITSRHVPENLTTAAKLAGAEAVIDKCELLARMPALLRGEHTPTPAQASISMQLSVREKQLVDAVCLGLSNGQIGARLGLTTNSVKTYLSRIYAKTGAVNRLQLARILTPTR